VFRLADRDRFAAYNGTAPIEVSSGHCTVRRLSRRGNRHLQHAVHMAAVTQFSQRRSDGRAYFDKKLAVGKAAKEAMRDPQTPGQRRDLPSLKADGGRVATGGRIRASSEVRSSDTGQCFMHMPVMRACRNGFLELFGTLFSRAAARI
jgi:Transposase IS116/IS110/IS902 family